MATSTNDSAIHHFVEDDIGLEAHVVFGEKVAQFSSGDTGRYSHCDVVIGIFRLIELKENNCIGITAFINRLIRHGERKDVAKYFQENAF